MPTDFLTLPGWRDDRLAELLSPLLLQCRRLALLPLDTALGGEGLSRTFGGRAGNWSDSCAALRALPPDADMHRFFQDRFAPYRLTDSALVTGYFDPTLAGALSRGGVYQTPVLARPMDLAQGDTLDRQGRKVLGRRQNGRLVPYFSRREIEAGAMGQTARPIAWLASPADLFFAQVQGSARIQLAEGGLLNLEFDGRNGQPYTPIGQMLVEQHALPPDQVSMQTIRAWLDAHPAQATSVMDRNESYVFFRIAQRADQDAGPTGALGLPLTPGRSAAVDRTQISLGTPVFVDSTVPDGRAWRHLVLAQDIGSAIAGKARIDVFLGTGAAAADWAGRMHQAGTLTVLLPRPAK